MLLEDHERRRFAEYCHKEAASTQTMIEQMELAAMPVSEALIKQYRLEALAHKVVAEKLDSIESETIGV